MKKRILIILSIIVIIIILIDSIKPWKKIEFGDYYPKDKDEIIEIDLNGDQIKEKVELSKESKFISINNHVYVMNKYIKDSDRGRFCSYPNTYYFKDLNNDGILEIIHKIHKMDISPGTREYTIYNFKKNNLKEVGKVSIKDDVGFEIFIKGKKLKFECIDRFNNKSKSICKLDI